MAWGWDELARVSAEMGQAARQIVPTQQDLMRWRSRPPSESSTPTRSAGSRAGDAFPGWMQKVRDRTVEELDGVRVDVPATALLELRIIPDNPFAFHPGECWTLPWA